MRQALKCAVLYVCRTFGLFALARRMTRHQLRILCYHGFELRDESSFRPKLFMTRSTFERRMQALVASKLPVLTLTDAVGRLYSGQLPPGATTITIDDGFLSVREIAAPVLHRLRLPSTLYVSTYYVQKQTPIFQVLVQYILWKAIRAGRREVHFDARWARETIDLGNPAALDRFTHQLVDQGNRCESESQRQAIAGELANALGVDIAPAVQGRILSLLTIEELRSLEAEGMAIEMHTHRHRFPPGDADSCRKELADNARVLEAALKRRTPHFCYPSGVWDRSQWETLREAGVESATTCEPGLNDAASPRYAMRRFLDSEVIAQIEFEAELAGLMELLRGLRARLSTDRGSAMPGHTVHTGE